MYVYTNTGHRVYAWQYSSQNCISLCLWPTNILWLHVVSQSAWALHKYQITHLSHRGCTCASGDSWSPQCPESRGGGSECSHDQQSENLSRNVHGSLQKWHWACRTKEKRGWFKWTTVRVHTCTCTCKYTYMYEYYVIRTFPMTHTLILYMYIHVLTLQEHSTYTCTCTCTCAYSFNYVVQ